jgi:hypothetical protein
MPTTNDITITQIITMTVTELMHCRALIENLRTTLIAQPENTPETPRLMPVAVEISLSSNQVPQFFSLPSNEIIETETVEKTTIPSLPNMKDEIPVMIIEDHPSEEILTEQITDKITHFTHQSSSYDNSRKKYIQEFYLKKKTPRSNPSPK